MKMMVSEDITHDDDQLSMKTTQDREDDGIMAGLLQQHYPEDITHDDYQLSTKPIQQKQLEIKKMMVSEDITHDDDQLSTKTTQDHEDDGIMETEEDFEEEESLFEDIVCYVLYLIVSVI